MTSLLHLILLPFSKTLSGSEFRANKMGKEFGIEAWLQLPSVLRAEQKHPGFREDMKRTFASLLGHRSSINLNDFVLLLLRVEQKHGVRLDENLPSPFRRITFPTSDFVSAYRYVIQPSLAKPLPLWLNGRTILGGDLESPSAITLAVLRTTDFAAFLEYAKTRATTLYGYGPHIDHALGDIVDALIDAKRREMDFFAWSG